MNWKAVLGGLTAAAILWTGMPAAGQPQQPTQVQRAQPAPDSLPSDAGRGPSAAIHREALRLIDAWLAAQRDFDRVPAMSVGIVAGDRLAWARGYGTIDARGRTPAAPDTIYAIGSISKLITAVALMQQVEVGRVALDDPVTKHLPWATLRHPDPTAGPVTIRALLSHASGLPREAAFPYWTAPDFAFPTLEQFRASVRDQTPLLPPGERYQYSNLALTLVGEVVAAAAGEPFERYARAHVLEPLGMRDTRAGLPRALLGRRLAPGFGGLDRAGARAPVPPVDPGALLPAGGFSSTVEDLARFAIWAIRLRRGEPAGLLSPASIREMMRVQFLDTADDVSFGLGFHVQRRRSDVLVGHDGEFPGYRAVLRIHPAGGTAVIILNNGLPPGGYAEDVLAVLRQRAAVAWRGEPPVPGVPLEDYAGRYSEQPWSAEGVVVPWAGGLAYLSLPTDDPANGLALFKPKGGDVFHRVRDDGSEAEEVRFVRDARGRVTHFVQNGNRHPRIERLPAFRGARP